MFKVMRKINNKKPILLSSVCALLVMVAAIALLYFLLTPKTKNAQAETPLDPAKTSGYVDTNPTTNSQAATGQSIKEHSLDTATSSDNSTPAITGQISSISQSGNVLYIRTIINSVTQAGDCTILMSGPSNKQYTATVGVQPLSSYATCKGFDIPLSQLASGPWTINVTYKSSAANLSLKGEVDIK